MSLEIMIVDDNDMIRYLHKELLSYCGISDTPVLFSNGKMALDYLVEKQQGASEVVTDYLVMLDLNMPIMNGLEFLSNLSSLKNKDKVHVLMISSSVEDSNKEEATSYSCVIDFIEKPIRFKECEDIKHIEVLKKHFVAAN